MIDEIKFEPIGKTKISKTRYWRERCERSEKREQVLLVLGVLMGIICGLTIGIII